MNSVTKVQFHVPVDGRTEYYFGSLAAIYERFTAEQIGCNVERLWNSNISADNPKVTSRCVITKHKIITKPQSKK